MRKKTFLMVLFWKNVEKYGKIAVFRAATAGWGKYRMGGYGRIGVYRVNRGFQGMNMNILYHVRCRL